MKANINTLICFLLVLLLVQGQVHNRRQYNVDKLYSSSSSGKTSNSQKVASNKFDEYSPKTLKDYFDSIVKAQGNGPDLEKPFSSIKGADLLFISNDKIVGDGLMVSTKIEALKELENLIQANVQQIESSSMKREILSQLKYELINLAVMEKVSERMMRTETSVHKDASSSALTNLFGAKFFEKLTQDSAKDRNALIDSKSTEEFMTPEMALVQASFMKYMNSAERKFNKLQLHKNLVNQKREEVEWSENQIPVTLQEATEKLELNQALNSISGIFKSTMVVLEGSRVRAAKKTAQDPSEDNVDMNWMNSYQRKMNLINTHKSIIESMWLEAMPSNDIETIGNVSPINSLSFINADSFAKTSKTSAADKKAEKFFENFAEQAVHMQWMNSAERKALKINEHELLKELCMPLENVSVSSDITSLNALLTFTSIHLEPCSDANSLNTDSRTEDYSARSFEEMKQWRSSQINLHKDLKDFAADFSASLHHQGNSYNSYSMNLSCSYSINNAVSSDNLSKKALVMEPYDKEHFAWMNSKERKMSLLMKHKSLVNAAIANGNKQPVTNALIHMQFALTAQPSTAVKRSTPTAQTSVEEGSSDFMNWMNSAERKQAKIELHRLLKDFADKNKVELAPTNPESSSASNALIAFNEASLHSQKVESCKSFVPITDKTNVFNHNAMVDALRSPARKQRMIRMHKEMKSNGSSDADFIDCFYPLQENESLVPEGGCYNSISASNEHINSEMHPVSAAVFPHEEPADEMAEIDMEYMNSAARKHRMISIHKALINNPFAKITVIPLH